jgi:protein-S-isoprenylcysteine O-methyltransferase Ste14
LKAAVGSLVFFAVAPCVFGGVVPYWLTGWRVQTPLQFWAPLRILGAVLVAMGLIVIVSAFARFVTEGIGTPAPVAPPQQLVIGGLYRYVRNPMYVALLTAVIGQALLLGQPALLVYAAVVFATVFSFVRLYEEPTLARLFGADYDAYRKAVPGWLPRLRPWKPGSR